MPLALLKYGLNPAHRDAPQLRWQPKFKKNYDVIIIGAGGHGLATAYYLASRHGISNIAVLDKAWLGGGNTARNTTIIRANYLTPEGVAFYKESVELFRGLSEELDINIMYSERGHFTLAHTDAAMRTARWRAEVNKHLGVDSEVIDADEVGRLCPTLNMSEDVRYPDPRRALSPARCTGAPRCGGMGLRQGRDGTRRGGASGHRGDRNR